MKLYIRKIFVKIISSIYGLLSLFNGVYILYLYSSFYRSFGSFASPLAGIGPINLLMIDFVLTPVVFLLAAISSIGLFNFMRWGWLLANTALVFYIVLFSGLLIIHFFPTIFAKSGSWFVFYHMNFHIDTFIIPFSVLSFLIIFNLKSFRIYYRK